jgi:hypothetical protein
MALLGSNLFDERAVSNNTETPKHPPLVSPPNAWRTLHRRTGGHVSRSTFYRWLESEKVYSVRFGSRIYIPWQALQDVIRRCLNGEEL